ncbi:MAG: hypothetical protein K9N29_11560 [Candidatus Marinimicrobia bacterium]|nr:hypothetical protein [Candidatus Neomarinimicrobiota bacterium]
MPLIQNYGTQSASTFIDYSLASFRSCKRADYIDVFTHSHFNPSLAILSKPFLLNGQKSGVV